MDTPKRPTVLIVDDEPELASLLKDILEDLGVVGVVTHCVEEALEALSHGQFDAVVSDMNMPGGTGMGLLGKIQKLPGQKPKFFMLTGDPSPEIQKEFAALGGAKLFAKPFDPEELIPLLTKP